MAAISQQDDLLSLLGSLCNGTITVEEKERLGLRMREEPDARRLYVKYLDLQSALLDLNTPVASDFDTLPPTLLVGLDTIVGDDLSVEPHYDVNPPSFFGFLGDACHGTTGYLSGHELTTGYIVATLLLGVVILNFYMNYRQASPVATDRSPVQLEEITPSRNNASESKATFVAHITSRGNCQWQSDKSTPVTNHIAQGDVLSLKSGLLELVYDTGAHVILQGPCSYTVDSANGGFLHIGKLTAKLEKDSKSQIANQQTSNPQSLIPNPLFFVRTPTATVTDLGTEFGVEVNKRGRTTSHVFRGMVELRAVSADGTPEGDAHLLHANQFASVEEEVVVNAGGNQNKGKNHNQAQSSRRRIVLLAPSAVPVDFAREVPNFKIKTFDLVDAVAGGDGYSGKRNSSIDPTTGRRSHAVEFMISLQPKQQIKPFGDRKYHRAEELPFVDGVFIPDGSEGPVQLDSAGHMWDWCPKTVNQTVTHIWAGGAIPSNYVALSTAIGDVDYSKDGHGLLLMHANVGITFDLNAVRRRNPGWTVTRFLSVLKSVEQTGETVVDYWILVDGKMRDRHRQFNKVGQAFPIAVPIDSEDRFLTLIITDGNDGFRWDCVIFGDPRLELVEAKIQQHNFPKADAKGGP